MNIEDFCREHGIEFRQPGEHHHSTSGFLQLDCPHCSPKSGKFRLGWNLKYKYASCWTCGKVPTIDTWCELTGLSPKEIRAILGDIESIRYVTQQAPGKLKIPPNINRLHSIHKNYLHHRGFSYKQIKELIDKWKIRGFDWKGKEYAWHIFIPIYADNQLISWTTRSIADGDTKKYKHAPSEMEKFPGKNTLYGIDFCQHSILVVEGPLDVWKVGPGAAAILGTAYTRAQMLAISRFQNRYICLDEDEPGRKAAAKLTGQLMMFPGSTFNIRLNAKDPGEASDNELADLRKLL